MDVEVEVMVQHDRPEDGDGGGGGSGGDRSEDMDGIVGSNGSGRGDGPVAPVAEVVGSGGGGGEGGAVAAMCADEFALRPKKRKVSEFSLSAVARNFFLRGEEEGKVVCQLCGDKLTWKTGTSSTGLRNHLERRHREDWDKRASEIKSLDGGESRPSPAAAAAAAVAACAVAAHAPGRLGIGRRHFLTGLQSQHPSLRPPWLTSVSNGSNDEDLSLARRVGSVGGHEPVDFVLYCSPSSPAPVMLGALHPMAWISAKAAVPPSEPVSQKQISQLTEQLGALGVEVLDVKKVLQRAAIRRDVTSRNRVETFAASNSLSVKVSDVCSTQEEACWTDRWKRRYLQSLTDTELADVVLLRPTITVCTGTERRSVASLGEEIGHGNDAHRVDGLHISGIKLEPATLHRDLSRYVTATPRGVVLAGCREDGKSREDYNLQILELVLVLLGMDVASVSRLPAASSLDCRSVVPAIPSEKAEDLLLVGASSDEDALHALMQREVLRAKTIAAVRLGPPDGEAIGEDSSHSMDHGGGQPQTAEAVPILDAVLAFVTQDLVIVAADAVPLQTSSSAAPSFVPRRRRYIVEEYNRTDGDAPEYVKRDGVELTRYLEHRGLVVLPVNAQSGPRSVLWVSGDVVLCSDEDVARQIVQSPHFRGVVELADVGAICGGLKALMQCARRERWPLENMRSREPWEGDPSLWMHGGEGPGEGRSERGIGGGLGVHDELAVHRPAVGGRGGGFRPGEATMALDPRTGRRVVLLRGRGRKRLEFWNTAEGRLRRLLGFHRLEIYPLGAQHWCILCGVKRDGKQFGYKTRYYCETCCVPLCKVVRDANDCSCDASFHRNASISLDPQPPTMGASRASAPHGAGAAPGGGGGGGGTAAAAVGSTPLSVPSMAPYEIEP